jgi:threonine/homoserine/homoserine lactone efflux protein
VNKKNLLWIIGGAVIAWYLWKMRKPAKPTPQPELLAVESTSAASSATFTPDYTPEQKIIQEAFNNC